MVQECERDLTSSVEGELRLDMYPSLQQQNFVPKMYPSFGYGAFFAFVASNEINNLRVINTP